MTTPQESVCVPRDDLIAIKQLLAIVQDINDAKEALPLMRRIDAALAAPSDWRDIATAPKDGTRILGILRHQNHWVYRVCYWRQVGETAGNWLTESGKWLTEPTHWQPLPSGPTPQEQESGK